MPDEPQMMDILAANYKKRKIQNTVIAIMRWFPKSTRQELTPLLQKEGFDNYEIIEIFEELEGPRYP